MTTWTPERTETLRHLIEDGKSASEIGGVMRISRNTVCGKAFREGWPMRGGKQSAEEIDRKNKTGTFARIAIPLVPRPKRVRPSRAKVKTPPKPNPSAELKPSLGLTIFELGYHTCRYPDGGPYDPAKTFCGHPTFTADDHDYSYCYAHCRRAFAGPHGRQWEAA